MHDEGTRRMPSSAEPVARARWPAYAAAGWALLFALRGVYWALGGTIGLATLSPEIQRLAAGAGGLLLVHGGSYASLLLRADTAQPEVRWYGLLWGPRFMLGGALFILAANAFGRPAVPGRPGVGLLVAAVGGGCVVAAAPQLLALVVGR